MRETSAKMSLQMLNTCVSFDMSLGWMDGNMKVREGRKAVEVLILWLGGGRKKQDKSGIGVQSDVSMDKGHCLKFVSNSILTYIFESVSFPFKEKNDTFYFSQACWIHRHIYISVSE